METKFEALQKVYDKDHLEDEDDIVIKKPIITTHNFSNSKDCNILCRCMQIEENILEEYLRNFDMDLICSCQHLSCEFMKKHYDKIHWSIASKTQILDSDLIYDLLNDKDKYTNRTIIRNLIKYQDLDNVSRATAFHRLKECVNFTGITYNLSEEITSNLTYFDNYEGSNGSITSVPRKFSLELIELLHKTIDWNFVSRYIQLPEYFITRYKDKVNWGIICKYQKLSGIFLVDNYESLVWDNVWRYQNLNESTIELLINLDTVSRFKWENISKYQNLSEDFIRKYCDKLDWEDICIHQKLSESFIEEFDYKVKWREIYEHQDISGSFINDHYDKLKPYIV